MHVCHDAHKHTCTPKNQSSSSSCTPTYASIIIIFAQMLLTKTICAWCTHAPHKGLLIYLSLAATQCNDSGIVTACHVTTRLLLHTKVASSAALQLLRPQLHHPTQCVRPNRPYHILAICAAGHRLNGFVLGSGDTNRLSVFEYSSSAARAQNSCSWHIIACGCLVWRAPSGYGDNARPREEGWVHAATVRELADPIEVLLRFM